MTLDQEAFGRLYDEHFDGIYRYVLIRVGNVAEAEDITSQTFYKALRGFWRLRRGARCSAWLFRIATNEVNSHYRRRRSRGKWEAASGPEEAKVASGEGSAEERLQRDEILEELGRALRSLPPNDQTLVALRYFERKPFAEIACILRTRERTLVVRTHRALRKLRAELERRGINHEGLPAVFAP